MGNKRGIPTSWLIFLLFLNFIDGGEMLREDGILPSRRRHQEPRVTSSLNDNVLACGAFKHVKINESLVIQSPNFNNRSENYSCKWRFLFPGCNLALSCPSFRLNDFFCFDYFEIKDTQGRTQRFCGRKGPNLSINTPNKEIEFSYKTSPIFNSVGFRCQVVCSENGDAGNGGGVLGILGGIMGGGGTQISMAGQPAPVTAAPPPPLPTPTSNCSCGEGAHGFKIVNGENTAFGEFPWMTAITRAGSLVPFCGASLINSRYVLTAAHCVKGRTPDNLQVILNDWKVVVGNESLVPPSPRKIEAIFQHRSYSARLDYDIALLKLSEPVDLTGDVVPVCLPTDSQENYDKKVATVSGWGATSEGGTLSRYLLKADVDVVTNEQCSIVYPFVVTDRMLCAYRENKDACQGDSGGPLVHAHKFKTLRNGMRVPGVKAMAFAKYTQIGIVSWGQGCARPMKYGVYSRITEFLPWIQSLTSDGSYCEA